VLFRSGDWCVSRELAWSGHSRQLHTFFSVHWTCPLLLLLFVFLSSETLRTAI